MRFHKSYSFFSVGLVFLLLLAMNPNAGFTQSRRQPPTTNDKKNKRPGEAPKEGEKQEQEPLPPDLTGKPENVEKVSIRTQVVTGNSSVYNKKSGRTVT